MCVFVTQQIYIGDTVITYKGLMFILNIIYSTNNIANKILVVTYNMQMYPFDMMAVCSSLMGKSG